MDVPQYVGTLGRSLRTIYNDVKGKLDAAHERNKNHYEKGISGEKFGVGDQSVAICTRGEARKNQEAGIILAGTIHSY